MRHAERPQHARLDGFVKQLPVRLRDRAREQLVAGIAVVPVISWREAAPQSALEHDRRVPRQARSVIEQMLHRHVAGIGDGDVRQNRADVRARRKLSFLVQRIERQRREHFADRADLKEVVGTNRRAPFHVRIAGGDEARVAIAIDDADRHPRQPPIADMLLGVTRERREGGAMRAAAARASCRRFSRAASRDHRRARAQDQSAIKCHARPPRSA